MSDGKDQNDVLGGKPPVFRDISVTAARENEFPAAILRRPSEQRMIGQELKSLPHAQDLSARFLGVLDSDEVKEPFEVGYRSLRYFDRRHA
jgi:hypothetical protein